jgi:hypothetical protein
LAAKKILLANLQPIVAKSAQGQQECGETWELFGERAGAAVGDEIFTPMGLIRVCFTTIGGHHGI